MFAIEMCFEVHSMRGSKRAWRVGLMAAVYKYFIVSLVGPLGNLLTAHIL